MTAFEVGTRRGRVVLILSVDDDDAGAISAIGISMAPDDARALVNSLGSAIKELSEVRAA
jgi:hypothetical protein